MAPCFKNGFLLFKMRGKEDDLLPKANLENLTVSERIANVKVLAIATGTWGRVCRVRDERVSGRIKIGLRKLPW